LPKEGYRERQAQVVVESAAILGKGALRCTLRNIGLGHVGTHGIWLGEGCQHNHIFHCHVHDIGAGGVYIGATTENPPSGHNVVDNNFIHHTCQVFQGAISAWIGRSSYNQLTHNEICDGDYTGVSVGWSWGFAPSSAHHNKIEYNHIHHCGHRRLSDMGGIYTLGVSPGTTLRYNLIHDLYCFPEYSHASGIYPDEGTSEMLIENNIVYRCTTSGFLQHYGRDNEVRNNIFAFAQNEGVSRCREEDHCSFRFRHNLVYSQHAAVLHRQWNNGNYEIDHNLYWSTADEPLQFAGRNLKAWQEMGNDVHSVVADPKFQDPVAGDFRLKPGSPALDVGFTPIDTSKIGLYGEPDWVNLPNTIEHMEDDPLPSPPPPIQINEDFDSGLGPGRKPPLGGFPLQARTHTEGKDHLVGITNETAAGGQQCLKVLDEAGLSRTYNPHFYYTPHYHRGMGYSGFDMRIEANTVMHYEWRDSSQPYRVGPSFFVRDGQLWVGGKPLLELPIGEWFRVEVQASLGENATGKWDLLVTRPGEQPAHFADLSVGSAEWNTLTWLGFCSLATGPTCFYLDNIELRVDQE
jgi:hypothetical protein